MIGHLYLCTGDRPEGFLDEVLSAGVDILQLREKELEARPLLEIAERFRTACDRYGATFIVNDRPDVALAAGAAGVHLGQDDLDPEFARSIMPSGLIGRSTHNAEQLREAFREDVDYICVGPVHETPTKPGRPATGLDLVRLAAKECPKPWFAIGGLNLETAVDAIEAGASRIVVVRAVTEADDPAGAVAALRALLPVPQA